MLTKQFLGLATARGLGVYANVLNLIFIIKKSVRKKREKAFLLSKKTNFVSNFWAGFIFEKTENQYNAYKIQ